MEAATVREAAKPSLSARLLKTLARHQSRDSARLLRTELGQSRVKPT